MTTELERANERLLEDVQRYTDAVGQDRQTQVLGAFDDLQSSIAVYAKAVAQETGWGNPFYGLPNPSEEEEEASELLPPTDVAAVWIECHYNVQVKDTERLRSIALQLLPDLSNGGPIDDAMLLQALCERTGWQPEEYGEEVLSVVEKHVLAVDDVED